MRRIFCSLAIVGSLSVLGAAQEPGAKPAGRPDFSGTWTQNNRGARGEVPFTYEGRANRPDSALQIASPPTKLVISQDVDKLTIEAYHPGPGSIDNTVEYRLNGQPAMNQFAIEVFRGTRPSEVTSRWQGNNLVSTIDVVVPSELELRRYEQTMSISPEGILAVRVQRVGSGDSLTNFYKKAPAANAVAAFAITGIVSDGDTRAPIEGAKVELRKVGILSFDAPFALSSADGRFTFNDVEPGWWLVSATKDTYIPGHAGKISVRDNPTPIEVGPVVPPLEAQVRLFKAATAGGRVTDSEGRPVRSAEIHLVAARNVGGPPIFSGGPSARTDERGDYRIDRITPGSYLVAVSSISAPGSAGPTVAPVYYPNSISAESAAPVTIGTGASLRFDFVLPPAGSLTISGHLESDGEVGYWPVTLTAIESNGEPSLIARAKASTDPQGTFAFRGLAPGRYRISSVRYGNGTERPPLLVMRLTENRISYVSPLRPPTDPVWYGQVDVTVEDKSLAAVPLRLEKAPSVTGQLVFEDGARQTDLAILNGGSIRLQTKSGNESFPFWVNEDGSFEAKGVPPGEYEFAFQGSEGRWPKGLYDVNGADLTQRFVSVGKTGAGPLRVVLTGQITSVVGAVEDASGRSCAAVVVVFTTESNSWNTPGPSARIRRFTTTDRGNFSIEGLLEGRYYVAAVKQGVPLDLSADGLSKLASEGKTITITPGKRTLVGLVAR